LRATNSTALGPGMLTAVGLASLGSPGSQVIVCTDGEANMGIGSYKDTGAYK
jgi:malic enzyme